MSNPNAPQKSWRTTAAGILTALGGLSTALLVVLNGGDLSTIDWSFVNVILGLFGVTGGILGPLLGGVVARDDRVSSEGKVAPKAVHEPHN